MGPKMAAGSWPMGPGSWPGARVQSRHLWAHERIRIYIYMYIYIDINSESASFASVSPISECDRTGPTSFKTIAGSAILLLAKHLAKS